MYGLLPPGKERHETLIDSYAGADVQSGLKAHYDRFLELNEVFKQLCTEWQVRGDTRTTTPTPPTMPSASPGWRSCVPIRSRRSRASPSALPRMARYSSRLDESAAKVAAGNTKLFTGVMCGSFHDVWMEMHEDLIVLLRINRVEEGSF